MRRALPLLILLICSPCFAQRLKAAEIPLREGAGIAEGRLRGAQQRRYTVNVVGQSLTLEMAIEPMRSLGLEVYDPDGSRVFLQKEASGRWTTPVAKPGIYSITIVRAVPTAPASVYRIRVSVTR